MSEMTETGKEVYKRTYSRTKADGTKENWKETVERVIGGNLALVDSKHHLPNEREDLIEMMYNFEIIPGGRHIWASGTQHANLFNCWVAGWTEDPAEHFTFTFLRLMEGGGVGANYSNKHLDHLPAVHGPHEVHIVCDKNHPDYKSMKDAGLLSDQYSAEWPGPFEVEDSREGWAAALADLFDAYYRPAYNFNRVYDVSRVRCSGSRLKTFGGVASGPGPLARMLQKVAGVLNNVAVDFDKGYHVLTGMEAMEIDHAIAECVVSGGVRRSARMSIMHWEDPQIGEFINCKADTDKHWTTNISVEVDTRFFDDLEDPNQAWYARDVLTDIATGMLANGEPGIWNSEYSNVNEPEEILATNPCGEITLNAWEPCCLGHVNLGEFIDNTGKMDYDRLTHAHRLMTRYLVRATNASVKDPKSSEIIAKNRRIGVGHLGFATFAAKRGVKYSQTPENLEIRFVISQMAEVVEDEAIDYSHWLRQPVPVKTRTVAPTGTIAKMPGVSEGVHPIFGKYFLRRIRFSTLDEDQMKTVEEYRAKGYKVEESLTEAQTLIVEIPTKDILMEQVEAIYGEKAIDIVQDASDLTVEDMLRVQAMYQELWADNAVSYTVNVDPNRWAIPDVVRELEEFLPNLKGATLFPEMSRPQSPYERISRADYEIYQMNMATEVGDSTDENCVSGACPVR